MACLGIRCGGHPTLFQYPRSRFCTDRSNQISQLNPSSSILNRVVKKPQQRISASTMTISNHPISSPCYDNAQPCNRIVNDEYEKGRHVLDEWMRDSVEEIVKNLKQAPLLVQVYENGNGLTKVKTEKAIAENWPNVKREWSAGERPSPDGIILVEELEGENDLGCVEDETSAWGVVVQGRGTQMERGPACFLLKTSRVEAGLGLFCTHFCLVKVKSFTESALSQLTDCWLLN